MDYTVKSWHCISTAKLPDGYVKLKGFCSILFCQCSNCALPKISLLYRLFQFINIYVYNLWLWLFLVNLDIYIILSWYSSIPIPYGDWFFLPDLVFVWKLLLRFYLFYQPRVQEPNTTTQEQFLPPPPKRANNNNSPMYHSKGTYNKSLEMFTQKVEKELFDPEMLKMLDKN